MFRRYSFLLLFSFITVTYADSAVQTDWSGGYWNPGWGPTGEWDDAFCLEASIEWHLSPMEITLHYNVEHIVDGSFNCASSVYSEDMDGDGDMDILGAARIDHDITWWENDDGSGTSWTEHVVDDYFFTAVCVHSADIDGDGDMDVLGAALNEGDISWWENTDGLGTSWTEHVVDDNYHGAGSVYSVDIDDDGDMDILGAAWWAYEITWWENVGGSGTSWTEHTIEEDYDGASSVYSEDIDGDGDLDILGTACWIDKVSWWENVGGAGASWVKHVVDEDYDGATSVYSEDVDGDGDMDVLGAAWSANEITWWENTDGSGISWIRHTIVEDFRCASSVHSADFDDDGDIDVLGSSSVYDGDIRWWENMNGSGTLWTEHLIEGYFPLAEAVYSADINGDGEMDALGAASGCDLITWWDLGEYPSDGFLESSCLYLHNDPGWGFFDWTAEEPPGTSVVFQVRSCDSPDSTNMGAWSDTLYSSCSLLGILDENDSYFQYRAILQTTDVSITPALNDVTVTWNPLGTGEGDPVGQGLQPFSPNPSSSPIIRFGLIEPAYAEIAVFDLAGRLVREIHRDEYSAGNHQEVLIDMKPGIYFCLMTTREFTATQRFVVIE